MFHLTDTRLHTPCEMPYQRERMTVNHDVVGSSPTVGAIPMLQKGNSQKDHKILWSFCCFKAIFCQYLVFGFQKALCVNLGKLF